MTTLNWWQLLPKNATTCTKDKAPLHWEVFGGMRANVDLKPATHPIKDTP